MLRGVSTACSSWESWVHGPGSALNWVPLPRRMEVNPGLVFGFACGLQTYIESGIGVGGVKSARLFSCSYLRQKQRGESYLTIRQWSRCVEVLY